MTLTSLHSPFVEPPGKTKEKRAQKRGPVNTTDGWSASPGAVQAAADGLRHKSNLCHPDVVLDGIRPSTTRPSAFADKYAAKLLQALFAAIDMIGSNLIVIESACRRDFHQYSTLPGAVGGTG